MKVAVVSLMTGVPWGGSEELWAAAARAAVGRGFAVEAHLPAWPTVPDRVAALGRDGVRVQYWQRYDPRPLARVANRVLRPSANLTRQVARTTADVLVVSLGSALDVAGYPALCEVLGRGGPPVVLIAQHNHETPAPGWARDRAARVYERAAGIVFVSDRNRRTAERQLATPIPKAVVLQNPVNLPSFDPVPWPAAGPARLACVARLEVWAKGQDVLFEALAGPGWAARDWHLSLFGEGPDRDYLAGVVRLYGLTNRVTFAGHARDLRAVWAGHDLLVLPSRSEGTPLALVEAQLAGRPAVVTDVGDSGLCVAEGETGFVADAPTAASVGRALARAWARRADWEHMGRQAHAASAARVDRAPGATLLDYTLRCLHPGGPAGKEASP